MRYHSQKGGILNKDNFWIGLALGFILPIVSYGILLTIVDFADDHIFPPDVTISRGFRDRTLSVIAICFNLIPFHIYQKKYADNTMRGLVFPTLLFVGIWFWIYGRQIVGI